MAENDQLEKCHATKALNLVLISKPELFCNIVGEPSIRLPPIRASPEGEVWPLRSERVRAWIAEFIWEKTAVVLFEKEITRMLTVLEGIAWKDQRLDLELKDAMDQEPVFEAVYILLHQNKRFEGTPSKLLKELEKTAKNKGLDVQDRSWPKGPAQLSRRINNLAPLFTKAGISIEASRKSGGERNIVLKNIEEKDDAGEMPSPPASVDKSHHPKQLGQIGVSDDEFFNKIKSSNERNES